MTNFWTSLWNRFANQRPAIPAVPRAETPATLRPLGPNEQESRALVFDPAVLHFPGAFRLGDPQFENLEQAKHWARCRCQAMDHILRVIAESRWADNLILRGSRLQKEWLGEAAREPGDLDWVVTPKTIRISDDWANQMIQGLVGDVGATVAQGGIEILTDIVAVDQIWAYERVPGARLVFPWRALGLPRGLVQCDFVFCEELADPPIRSRIELVDGGNVQVQSATPEQSLAWKILWLDTDMHPQGKDLYDAVLLAEKVSIPFALLEKTYLLTEDGKRSLRFLTHEFMDDSRVDWENFQKEFPQVTGDVQEWVARLRNALQPTFAQK